MVHSLLRMLLKALASRRAAQLEAPQLIWAKEKAASNTAYNRHHSSYCRDICYFRLFIRHFSIGTVLSLDECIFLVRFYFFGTYVFISIGYKIVQKKNFLGLFTFVTYDLLKNYSRI